MSVKRILDPAFRYRPSYDTNVRETFEKARREHELQRQAQERAQSSEVCVVKLKRRLEWPTPA
jgi:hypothetical protein